MPLTQPYQRRERRASTHVDEKGRIFIPDHIRRNIGMEPGQLVELQIAGGSYNRKTLKLVIHQSQRTHRGKVIQEFIRNDK